MSVGAENRKALGVEGRLAVTPPVLPETDQASSCRPAKPAISAGPTRHASFSLIRADLPERSRRY